MTVQLHQSDPSWPGCAVQACAELTQWLPGAFVALEHIGSTSVPGLVAKPVIDLMGAVERLDDVAAREDALGSLGYSRFETGMVARLFYRRQQADLGYQLHVVTADTWETRNERLLRDWLLDHPEDRQAYADLKRGLAATHLDGDAYTRAKTELIQQIVDRARAARRLPWVSVWE